MSRVTSLLILYLLIAVNACKINIQLEPEKNFQLTTSTAVEGCEYEIYTGNQFIVNAECRAGGCGKGLYLRLSLEGYSLKPITYSCQDSIKQSSSFQRMTLAPDINLDFECNFTATKSSRSWGWSKIPKDFNSQVATIYEFPYYVAHVYLPTKTIFCGGSICMYICFTRFVSLFQIISSK